MHLWLHNVVSQMRARAPSAAAAVNNGAREAPLHSSSAMILLSSNPARTCPEQRRPSSWSFAQACTPSATSMARNKSKRQLHCTAQQTRPTLSSTSSSFARHAVPFPRKAEREHDESFCALHSKGDQLFQQLCTARSAISRDAKQTTSSPTHPKHTSKPPH